MCDDVKADGTLAHGRVFFDMIDAPARKPSTG
jgi:hypothetical protein